MSSPAQLHFVSGKGGVGKSTIAAALALGLAERDQGPVLLIDIQGSGRGLRLLGLDRAPSFEIAGLPKTRSVWGARILPRDTFKQYFGLLLALGNDNSTFAQATSGIRNKVADLVVENKVVSAFVDACPGLEPSVLLGKVHWECLEGRTPETERPWKHVVVDAPATGHGVMLFRSTFALIEVFGSGVIFRQASKIREFMQDPRYFNLHLVATAEELPIQELKEMKAALDSLKLLTRSVVINRCPPVNVKQDSNTSKLPAAWAQEIAYQSEAWVDQQALIDDAQGVAQGGARLVKLPEIFNAATFEGVQTLSKMMVPRDINRDINS
jgi:anion-transporting  ArsA/GET3 family ATPase